MTRTGVVVAVFQRTRYARPDVLTCPYFSGIAPLTRTFELPESASRAFEKSASQSCGARGDNTSLCRNDFETEIARPSDNLVRRRCRNNPRRLRSSSWCAASSRVPNGKQDQRYEECGAERRSDPSQANPSASATGLGEKHFSIGNRFVCCARSACGQRHSVTAQVR
jgi:hypothetical protein